MTISPLLPTLGVDIGRVLIGPVIGGQADTSFLGGSFERAMQTPPSPGAFEAMETLVQAFAGRVHLVSKCGSSVQDKTWHWLRHQGFWEATGMKPKHVRFCLRRPEKAGICAELGITHFVDDRVDIIASLSGVVATRVLFGEQGEGVQVPKGADAATTWAEVLPLLLPLRVAG